MYKFRKRGINKVVTALNISNNILCRAFEDNVDITPMKLQKMIFFVYKRYLQMAKKPLFAERFEPWKYGPVVRSVYDYFSYKKSNRIDTFCRECDGKVYIGDENNKQLKEALDFVWNKYKDYNGLVLSELTHRPGTAWRKSIDNHSTYLDDQDIITEEFYDL